jgi:hypothetical protein
MRKVVHILLPPLRPAFASWGSQPPCLSCMMACAFLASPLGTMSSVKPSLRVG